MDRLRVEFLEGDDVLDGPWCWGRFEFRFWDGGGGAAAAVAVVGGTGDAGVGGEEP